MSNLTFIAMKMKAILSILGLIWSMNSHAQVSDSLSFWEPSPTFNSSRFNKVLGFGSVAYGGFSTGLYYAWYRQYDLEGFHFFDDMGEWKQMDKAGHIYTAYLQGVLCYKGAKWTGLSDRKAIWTGIICGSLFQTTIEVMDGFSSEWGFSIGDFGANVLGTSAFALQQHYWGEQRIVLKESSWARNHPNSIVHSVDGTSTTTLSARADDLFGTGFFEKYLKDYNNQTYWASFNIRAFKPEWESIPKWLNVAIGYGANGLYGGFENEWEIDGQRYISDTPRYRQWYISLDVDLDRIETDHAFLNTLLSVFNIIKIPAPALEITSRGEVKLHLLHF